MLALTSRRVNSAALYAAIPPVMPSTTRASDLVSDGKRVIFRHAKGATPEVYTLRNLIRSGLLDATHDKRDAEGTVLKAAAFRCSGRYAAGILPSAAGEPGRGRAMVPQGAASRTEAFRSNVPARPTQASTSQVRTGGGGVARRPAERHCVS